MPQGLGAGEGSVCADQPVRSGQLHHPYQKTLAKKSAWPATPRLVTEARLWLS